jgi:hypothetical protein
MRFHAKVNVRAMCGVVQHDAIWQSCRRRQSGACAHVLRPVNMRACTQTLRIDAKNRLVTRNMAGRPVRFSIVKQTVTYCAQRVLAPSAPDMSYSQFADAYV